MTNTRMKLASYALAGMMAFTCCVGFTALAPADAHAATFTVMATDADSAQHIGKKTARKIALEHAGYKAKQVDDLKTVFGTRDGKDAYLVRFRFKKMKYSYAVNAETGEIISYSAKVVVDE